MRTGAGFRAEPDANIQNRAQATKPKVAARQMKSIIWVIT